MQRAPTVMSDPCAALWLRCEATRAAARDATGRAARDGCAASTVGATRGASAVAMAVQTACVFACILICLLACYGDELKPLTHRRHISPNDFVHGQGVTIYTEKI